MSNVYIGWFDNARKPLATKVSDAAAAYKRKFGVTPNVVLISPRELEAQKEPVVMPDGVALRPAAHIPPNNYWAGREERA